MQPRTLAFAVRLLLLGFAFIVAALDAHPRRILAGALGLVAAAIIAYIPARRGSVLGRLLPTVESCIAAASVIAPPADRTGLLPYLLAPAFAAGLIDGTIPATIAVGMAAFVLLVGHSLTHSTVALHTFAANSSQWVLLALAVGLLAAWVRRLASDSEASDANSSYVAAYELLSQLRTVSRQLSGGLDAVSLAQALLQNLQEVLPFDRGAVFVRTDGGRLVPLALQGASYVDWDTSLDDGTSLGEAWRRPGPSVGVGGLGEPVGMAELPARSAARQGQSHAVMPLRMGERTFGLVALESGGPNTHELNQRLGRTGDTTKLSDHGRLAPALRLIDETALRLETALLFGEIRSIATAEERRRLAREIHDGIAQELASLGYVIDDLVADSGDEPLAEVLRSLRHEVTRIVGELRLSIFDLRSEVAAQVGLGSALSDYVRAVSVGATFSVHVILDESPDRLPITVESELLRIAQEAITNARKHAAAEHLWVTCRVDPPFAHLRIEDDGRGMGAKRHDSFGLEVMRERAARLGAQLTIGARQPRGTFVDVRLGEHRTRAHDANVDLAELPRGSRPAAPGAREHEEGNRDGRERAAR